MLLCLYLVILVRFFMIPKPCLHPVRVFNKTLHEWHYVACGHCAACVNSKGFNRSQRLGEAVARYTHKYFFTLTFSDDFLPVAKYDHLTDTYIHPYDCDYNGVFYSVGNDVIERSLANKDFEKSFRKYNGVPVLSRRLIINFKKRLRKIFAKYYGKEYLFVYVVGEYGPTTLRPHYHGILCSNAPVRASILEMCVRSAWSRYDKVKQEYVYVYGQIDFQRIISKGVRNYVAQYLNCVTSLPIVYSSTDFRPFFQSSPLINSDVYRFSNTSLKDMFTSCNPVQDCKSSIDNLCIESVLPAGIINRVFPKCPQFSSLTTSDRVQLYSVYQKQFFSSAKDFAETLINCFDAPFGSLSLAKSLLVDLDYNASYTRLVKLYYLSRKVCLNAAFLHVSIWQYVDRIELFWSRFELLKLKRFYELQESLLNDLINPCSLADIFSLYYDTDNDIRHIDYYISQFHNPSWLNNIDFIPVQASYSCLMSKICLDSTKVKKRNDYFASRGLRRKKFLPNLNKNVKRFFFS